MDASQYQTYFVDAVETLLKKLSSWLDSDTSISYALTRFQTAKTVLGPRMLMVTFFDNVQPYLAHLWKHDQRFFDEIRSNSGSQSFSDLGSSDMWSQLSDEQKDFVWKRIEAMVLLAAKALGVDHSALYVKN